jgi:hypothetical protein
VPDEGIAGVVCTGEDDPANLLVVRLGSRDKNVERLRSNRLHRDRDISDTAPPSVDTVVSFFTYDGSAVGFPNYGHAGGLQVVDNILVVPLEAPYGGGPDALLRAPRAELAQQSGGPFIRNFARLPCPPRPSRPPARP